MKSADDGRTDDNGRTDDGAYLYYKLAFEPKNSGVLKCSTAAVYTGFLGDRCDKYKIYGLRLSHYLYLLVLSTSRENIHIIYLES